MLNNMLELQYKATIQTLQGGKSRKIQISPNTPSQPDHSCTNLLPVTLQKIDLEGGEEQDETKKDVQVEPQKEEENISQKEEKQDEEKAVDEKENEAEDKKKDEEAEALAEKNKQEEMERAEEEKKKEEEAKKMEEEKKEEKKDEVQTPGVEVKPQPSKADLMAVADFECVCHPTKIKNPKICCTYEQHTTSRSFSRIDPGDYEGQKNAEGLREGTGTCKWGETFKYEGQWKDDVRSGQGTFTCTGSASSTYTGGWENDLKEGNGQIEYQDRTIIGRWDKDRLYGLGKVAYKKNKREIPCTFYHDILIHQAAQIGCSDQCYYFLSFLLTVIFYAGPIMYLIKEEYHWFALMAVWIIYIIVSCRTNTNKHILNVYTMKQFFDHMKMNQKPKPKCTMSIQNYHFEEKKKAEKPGKDIPITKTGAKIKPLTSTSTSKMVRVNTQRHEAPFHYRDFVDRSPNESAFHYIFDLFFFTKVTTLKKVTLGPIALKHFEEQKAAFLGLYKSEEQYDFEFRMELPGPQHCCVYNNDKSFKPWFSRCTFMFLLDLVSLGWYQRWRFDTDPLTLEYCLDYYIIE